MDKVIQIANLIQGSKFNNPQYGRVYSPKGISPCIDTMGGGQQRAKIFMDKVKKRYVLGRTNGGARIKEEMAHCHFMSIPASDV